MSVTSINGYGYQVAILCPVIMCSGVLVTTKNVVTTASCINTLLPQDVIVQAGSAQYFVGGYQSGVSAIVQHNQYNPSNYDYNVAVLTLTTPYSTIIMSTYNIITIPIATAMIPTNSYAFVTAYGAIDALLTLPDYLQKASLLVYPTATCQAYKKNRITASQFCVGDPAGKKDLCPGDQGAPMVYNNAVNGIYNWGCSCGLAAPNPSSPVFTNLVFLRSWIQKIINAS